jgi:hypothetical protein
MLCVEAEDSEYTLQFLRNLMDIGSDLMALMKVEMKALRGRPSPKRQASAKAADLAVRFERLSRAICLAVLLSEPSLAAYHTANHRVAARARIILAVEETIRRGGADTDATPPEWDAFDRPGGPNFDGTDQRPMTDIIADICRDLGSCLPRDQVAWKSSAPDDVVALCSLAAGIAPVTSKPTLRLVSSGETM